MVGGGVLGTMHAFTAHGTRAHGDAARSRPRGAEGVGAQLRPDLGERPCAGRRARARARRRASCWERHRRNRSRASASVPTARSRSPSTRASSRCCEAVARRAGRDRARRSAHARAGGGAGGESRPSAARVLGALHCARDAIVEPGRVLPALRAAMTDRGGYTFVGGPHRGRGRAGSRPRSHRGRVARRPRRSCARARRTRASRRRWLAAAPLRRCRLQMMQTAPLDERLTTSIADGDSLRYYPAFAVPEAAGAPGPGAGRRGVARAAARSPSGRAAS